MLIIANFLRKFFQLYGVLEWCLFEAFFVRMVPIQDFYKIDFLNKIEKYKKIKLLANPCQ